jgi:TPR repeat protein
MLTGGLHASPAAVTLPKMISPAYVIWAQNKNADFWVENVAGPPGIPLPVRVVVGPALLSPDDDRDEPAVNFSGLLDRCRLSAGSKRTRSWYVPIAKLEGLMLVPQEGCEGDFSVLVMIYDGKNVRNDTRTILFSIHTGTGAPSFAPRSTQPEISTFPPIAPAEEEALLKKGALLLKNGDVSAARLNFENLALRGSSKGAFALAQSYDPAVLHSMEIAGLRPDMAKAKEWYTKAAALGDQEAARRLSVLNSVNSDGAPAR